jgi:hypothetical protein
VAGLGLNSLQIRYSTRRGPLVTWMVVRSGWSPVTAEGSRAIARPWAHAPGQQVRRHDLERDVADEPRRRERPVALGTAGRVGGEVDEGLLGAASASGVCQGQHPSSRRPRHWRLKNKLRPDPRVSVVKKLGFAPMSAKPSDLRPDQILGRDATGAPRARRWNRTEPYTLPYWVRSSRSRDSTRNKHPSALPERLCPCSRQSLRT